MGFVGYKMSKQKYCNYVSLLALSSSAILFASHAARAQTVSASQLQRELNSLQTQINMLRAQQSALNEQQTQLKAQAAHQAEVTAEQEKVAHQQAKIAMQQASEGGFGDWKIVKSDKKAIPIIETKDGKNTFSIGGQVEVDAGLGSVPGQRGFSGGTNFRRVEFYVQGIYDGHYLYKIENDWTKTSTPLGGLLDVYAGYKTKIGKFDNVFLVGNQHTPFGFQTASDATLFLENELGNSLFQDNRQLGITGQTYSKHLNFWYGFTGTNNGTQSSAANSTTTINTGSTQFKSEYTASTVWAWNIINTPGHLLSIRNSLAYNRYNGSDSVANQPNFTSKPDLNIYGASFIATGALPIQAALVESPRIDFEYNRFTAAAVYYDTSTFSNARISKTNHGHLEPHFSSWDIEAQYFLTDDYEPYSDYHGYYESVDVNHPVTKGGIGAIQLAARLDEANLNDAKYNIHGGNETNLTLGVNWWPTSNTQINLNYVHMFPIGGGTHNRQQADMVATRLEFIY